METISNPKNSRIKGALRTLGALVVVMLFAVFSKEMPEKTKKVQESQTIENPALQEVGSDSSNRQADHQNPDIKLFVGTYKMLQLQWP